MAAGQSPTMNGHLQHPSSAPRTYSSNTLPDIRGDTIVVAAAHPSISNAHAEYGDGWCLSDFYAFNYLLKGVGLQGTRNVQVEGKTVEVQGQTWLTAANPREVIRRWPNQTQLLHGMPCVNRCVVLSEELLAAREHTDVTLVEPDDMIDTFVRTVKHASQLAKEMDAPLLLLMFCYGPKDDDFLLDDKNESKVLKPTHLRDVIETGCRVTLVAPASYAGGWIINTDFTQTGQSTGRNEGTPGDQGLPHRMGQIGSAFAGNIIESLTSGSISLLAGIEEGFEEDSLQSDDPTRDERKEYDIFCQSILVTYQGLLSRFSDERYFNFCEEDDYLDELIGRRGIPLAYFRARWDRLPVPQNELESGRL